MIPENLWGSLDLDQRTRRRAVKDADQIELYSIKNGTAPYQLGVFDDELADSLADDYPVPDFVDPDVPEDASALSMRNRIALQDNRRDEAVSRSVDELRRRSVILGSAYPFTLSESRLDYTGSSTLIYEFCLAVTCSPSLTRGDYVALPRAFERLAGKIAQLWLGNGAQLYRTGAPPDGDRPSTFREMMMDLQRATDHELTWEPRTPDHDAMTSGDAGLDLVVWRRPADHRLGGITLMGQCACGDDWSEKFKDLDLDDLRARFCRLPPAGNFRFFATPHHVAHRKLWVDSLVGAGLVFDRVRLALIAEEEPNRVRVVSEAKKPYEDLIKIVVPNFERSPWS
ncbi:MAG: hypothetical protein P4L85_02740 [Paludisphaera borealis]|uniref:hypothetical protein n=1 Tax=Paludisphaera borealis TaxID=1387353 RepID=UPI00283FB414|nr:hypothetical protein [Paludisphaera borealis]MDR3618239.1 hypothetical protein [Paludisphaera borealis]